MPLYPSEFPTAPIAGRPAPDAAIATRGVTYSSKAVTLAINGSSVNSAFPMAKRIARIEVASQNIGLTYMMLSSSIATADGTVMLVAMRDVGEVANLSENSDLFLSHIVTANTNTSVIVPVSRSNVIGWDMGQAYRLMSGNAIGLYACATNNAGNVIAATLDLHWFPLAP